MRATFLAEWTRLTRRRTLWPALIAALVFAAAGAALVLAAAEPAARVPTDGMMPTLEELADPGGGTQVFRSAVAFAGTLLFALLCGVFALEFSRGTYRTMLFAQPRRVPLLVGRLAALLAFAAAGLACAELLMWLVARLLAGSFDVDAGAWISLDGIGSAAADYATVLVWVTGYATFALLLAMLLRSVPLTLAVGIAWAGPFEHLTGDAWSAGKEFFPGLLLEALGQGGTPDVSATRALLTLAAYSAAFLALSATAFARRDVTA
ncbi:ABC transporter permease [Streptomyces hoynatensis]|uniref:ABC transporter permease n=1 Tax=Streptomyces hoynatensis TaxID=1141874 RepID=A0A3A9ZIX2_9ACTN|nr:ABC transporter permease [Streptomyces hoynatensis]